MKELHYQIDQLLTAKGINPTLIQSIKKEDSMFPFSQESQILSYLLATKAISYEQYEKIVQDYNERNKYLSLFDMAPRTFGQTWGEQHLLSLFPEFTKATKKNLENVYPSFDGEFDLWYDGIRIEVKACRANNTKNQESLASRAYLHSEAKAAGFQYHYQQLKPSCCDVFIWIGVCRDEILYWVLTSEELKTIDGFGPQHRNINTGIDGIEVFEGQVFMTEEELSPFQVSEADVLKMVIKKGK